MRLVTRALAVTAAALPLATLVAIPASASPEDGKGCAGLPAIPASYVCVISATPQNAVPTTTTTNIPVTVPRVCYVADCTGPTTVNVPVPGAQPGTNAVAVLWYQGVYYPIAIGQVPSLQLVQPYVQLVTGTVNGAVTTATNLANGAVTTATTLANGAVTLAVNTAGNAYTTAIAAYNDAYQDANQEVNAAYTYAVMVVGNVVDSTEPYVDYARDLVNDPPTTRELLILVLGDWYYTIQELAGALRDCLNSPECIRIQS